MMETRIDAKNVHFKELNEKIREAEGDVLIDNCMGQRFICSGLSDKRVEINGVPGNALGAYLDGAKIVVNNNAQDAVGDTMNDGEIVVNGDIGDALGYAMRGGKIYVLGNSGYRTGIHMKEYSNKKPTIIIGGTAGSFLGEYLAGGVIVILNLEHKEDIVGSFTGTGMHGGKIFLRTDKLPCDLPKQVSVSDATEEDLAEISEDLKKYMFIFGLSYDIINKEHFYVLRPNTQNPYKRLYTPN